MKTSKLSLASSAMIAFFIFAILTLSFPASGISSETDDELVDSEYADKFTESDTFDEDIDNETVSEDVEEYLDSIGLRMENGALVNQYDEKIPPTFSGGQEVTQSKGCSESGEQSMDEDALTELMSDGQSQLTAEDTLGAPNCNWRWVHGSHKWKYWTSFVYTYAKFQAATWTTWGTRTGSCGRPLKANRLYFNAKIKGDIMANDPWVNFSWSKTGYNTARISGTRHAYTLVSGYPCGMRVRHEATYRGSKWHTITSSGCLK